MKAWSLTVAVALATLTFAQDTKPMVSVNGETITQGYMYKRMAVLPNVGRVAQGRFVPATPGFLALQQIINERLMIQLAKSKGVEPTDKQITDEINRNVKENPDYIKSFLRSGLTEEDLRYDLKVQLAEFNVTTMGITITDFQVKKFYDDQKRMFTLPIRYKLRVIAVYDLAKKDQIDKELKNGTSFADAATKYSDDLSKIDGGLMGTLGEDALGENIKALVKSMKEGSVSPWLGGESGSEIKLYVEKVLPSEVMPFNDELKLQIWKKLMVDRGQVKNDVSKMMTEMRKNAKYQYYGTPFDPDLKSAFGG